MAHYRPCKLLNRVQGQPFLPKVETSKKNLTSIAFHFLGGVEMKNYQCQEETDRFGHRSCCPPSFTRSTGWPWEGWTGQPVRKQYSPGLPTALSLHVYFKGIPKSSKLRGSAFWQHDTMNDNLTFLLFGPSQTNSPQYTLPSSNVTFWSFLPNAQQMLFTCLQLPRIITHGKIRRVNIHVTSESSPWTESTTF